MLTTLQGSGHKGGMEVGPGILEQYLCRSNLKERQLYDSFQWFLSFPRNKHFITCERYLYNLMARNEPCGLLGINRHVKLIV